MLPTTSSLPHLIVFLPSSVSCLLLPVFLLSCLPHMSTQSAHLSLGLPRLLLPCSLVVCHPPSFLRVQPTVICSSPVSIKLLCTPVSSLNSTFLLLSAHVTLAIYRTQLFSHTCSLCCCSSVIAKVSVPYKHAGVTQVLMTLPFSLFEIRQSAITPSTALHAFALACTLRRTSLSVFPSPHTAPLRLLLFTFISTGYPPSAKCCFPGGPCTTCITIQIHINIYTFRHTNI